MIFNNPAWNAFHNSSVEIYFIGVSCLLRTLHKILTGFRSGELPGQGKTLTFLFFRNDTVLFALCGGTKYESWFWENQTLSTICMSCRISFWYFSAFILSRILLRSQTPWLVKHSQMCILGLCLITGCVNVLLYFLFDVLQTLTFLVDE